MKVAFSSKSLKTETEYTITKMKHLFIPVMLMKKQAQKGEFAPGHRIPDSGPRTPKSEDLFFLPCFLSSQRMTPLLFPTCGTDAYPCSPFQMQKDKSTDTVPLKQ